MKKTGAKIKTLCQERHITVKDIHRELCISAPQSVYAWFTGKTLPSLDNMYCLSKLLNIHIEDMIVMNVLGEFDATDLVRNIESD